MVDGLLSLTLKRCLNQVVEILDKLFLASIIRAMLKRDNNRAMTPNKYLFAIKLLYEKINSEVKVTRNINTIGTIVKIGFTPVLCNQTVIVRSERAANS